MSGSIATNTLVSIDSSHKLVTGSWSLEIGHCKLIHATFTPVEQIQFKD